ncbi:MAG: Vgb family protein [Candidatus Dormibacter sp.]|uniref:Vgb family protein n=1 Tax=Candidatus Dormibacter sp. TaxID=2973982 RepID=UPI003D9AF0A8
MGRITAEGQVTEIALGGSHLDPIGLTVGPDQALWVAELSGDRIDRVALDGTVGHHPVSRGVGAQGIVAAADGKLWFTESRASRVGRLDPASGQVQEDAVATGAWPDQIAAGQDGSVWVSEYNSDRMGRVM